jgi:hypothetical protein
MTEHEQAQLRQYLEKLGRVGLIVQGESPSGLLAVGTWANPLGGNRPVSLPVGTGPTPSGGVVSWPARIDGETYDGFMRDLNAAHEALEPRACPRKLGTFGADVHLLDTLTGERAVYHSTEYVDNDGVWSPYMWEEGNFSCDCNRGIFFEQATAITDDDAGPLEHPCGEGRYRVERIIDLRDGAELYAELPT